MLINKIPSNTKLFKCDDDISKIIYDNLGVIPINVYYCNATKKNVNVYVLSKKLSRFLKNKKIEVAYE